MTRFFVGRTQRLRLGALALIAAIVLSFSQATMWTALRRMSGKSTPASRATTADRGA